MKNTIHHGKTIDIVKEYRVIDCKNCKFRHVFPILSQEQLSKIYINQYYLKNKPLYIKENIEDKKWWETVYKDRIDFLEKNTKYISKNLLEIGSGPGLFLQYAKKRGWDVIGIEPSEKAASFSRKNGIKIIQDYYENINLSDFGKFDAVVMYEFLEHIPDPIGVLKLSFEILNKDGIISIGVPNDYNPLQEVMRKKLKPYWVAPPYHLNYFTLTTITNLLKRIGFNIIHKETNFPLEIFLLMGDIYINDNKLGRMIHGKRKKFDTYLSQMNNKLKLKLYEKLAEIDIGRDITIYAKKP